MMRSAATLSVAFLLLLAVSIGLKVRFVDRSFALAERHFAGSLAARLRLAGFTTRIEHRPQGYAAWASSAECTVMARSAERISVTRHAFEAAAAGFDKLVYVYGARAALTPPIVLPTLTTVVQEQLGRIGIAIAQAPLLAIATRGRCDLRHVDFRGLRIWPRSRDRR